MHLAVRAERNGVARVSARPGRLPVPTGRIGRLILVDEPRDEAWYPVEDGGVFSADQRADQDRQAPPVTACATAPQTLADKVVTGVGPPLNGHRRTLLVLLDGPSAQWIVVEYRDRLGRFGSEYVQPWLAAQGRELVVVGSAEIDGDLTSVRAGPFGERVTENRAGRGYRGSRGRLMGTRFEVPEGWCVQAFQFALDPTEGGLRRWHRRRGRRVPELATLQVGQAGRVPTVQEKGRDADRVCFTTGAMRNGSQLVVADRWFPSSKTCHASGNVPDIGWAQQWRCDGCTACHQRDNNAAINLARYEEPTGDSAVGPVGAAAKRGADRKTRPGGAGGCEAWK